MFNEGSGGQPSANWGGTVTQGGVEKPVLEVIVDMMNADNIKENLKYVVMCMCFYVYIHHMCTSEIFKCYRGKCWWVQSLVN